MDHNGTLYNNESDPEEDRMLGFSPLVDILPIVLAVLIIVTNGLVLLLFAKNHRLRTITNAFLVSLAISDLITGTFAIPFYLVCSSTHYMLCGTTYIFWRFTSISTVLHLLVVTIDRYAAIVHAIRYHSIVTRTRACIAIVTVWSLAAVDALIQLSWPTIEEAEEQNGPLSNEEREKISKANGVYQSVNLGVFFAFPLLFMMFSYIRIFNIVRYHGKQIKRQNLPSDLAKRKKSAFDIPAQWKSAVVFMVMTAVYVICWFPYFFYEPLEELLTESSFPPWVEYVFFYYPRFVTSFTNPLVYIVGKHDFKQALCPRKDNKNRTHMTSLITRGQSHSNIN